MTQLRGRDMKFSVPASAGGSSTTPARATSHSTTVSAMALSNYWRAACANPIDVMLTILMIGVLFMVLDAGVHMPRVNRKIQLTIASIIMAFGGWLFTLSSYALPSAGMLLPGSDPKGKNKPLTSGHHVFGLCRHPQYAGLLALCLSICLISQSADRLFYTLILMIVLDKKADLEEHDMVKSHPEYARYLLQVPKFIPSLTALWSSVRGVRPAKNDEDEGASLLAHEGRSGSSSNVTAPPPPASLMNGSPNLLRGSPHKVRLMDAHSERFAIHG